MTWAKRMVWNYGKRPWYAHPALPWTWGDPWFTASVFVPAAIVWLVIR